jgi:AbrB family looped-hinge helix DNA binding protein
MHIDIASFTSKGQFTVPRKFRRLLRLSEGSKMLLVCDGKHLLLKPIKPASAAEFKKLINHADKLSEKAKKLSKKRKRGEK